MNEVFVIVPGFQDAITEQIDLLKISLQGIYDRSESIALNNLSIETQKEFKKISRKISTSKSYSKCLKIIQSLSRKWVSFSDKHELYIRENIEVSEYIRIIANYITAYSKILKGLVFLYDEKIINDSGHAYALIIGIELISESVEIFPWFFSEEDLHSLLKLIDHYYSAFSQSRTIESYFSHDADTNNIITRIKSICVYSKCLIESRLDLIDKEKKSEDLINVFDRWGKDLDEAEDLTEEEEKAYERVMKRLGA